MPLYEIKNGVVLAIPKDNFATYVKELREFTKSIKSDSDKLLCELEYTASNLKDCRLQMDTVDKETAEVLLRHLLQSADAYRKDILPHLTFHVASKDGVTLR